MSKKITITQEDLFHTVKINCQIPDLIEKFISRKIIEEEAQKLGIIIEVKELQEAADKFRFMTKLDTVQATNEWLEKNQLSVDDFEEISEFNLIAGKLMQELFADKVEPYFYQNQLNYIGAILYEIIVDDEDLALELFYIVNGKEMSFFDVANQYITDSEMRRKCGYLGLVNRKDLKAEISPAVFAANPPQVLKPITTSKGHHVIFVDEIIKPELDDKLRFQIMSDLFSEWVKQKITEVEIVTE
jgi:parvulin-like peptidyl-prolyl isomerase